ncbi:sensor domain-containing phosphodiesterase [Jeotgalibacillus salarius]|uniref:GGDEF domain-containing protein n=1 Tax=Jeotgalibacillus salarius TaxID=546023 RepID=A0A4Y8LDY3_9BACL|nr:sensor domain-containing phosphodiesterase [Jeotgalibacillus salarius]TFE00365.1 GGDEF domain-containing protein [Jeotgalibacillus salarius]
MSKIDHSLFRIQQQRLFQLAKAKKISAHELQSTVEQLCEAMSEMIQCERVGVWVFDKERPALTALNIYEDGHSKGDVLHKKDFPKYFKLLQGTRVLSICDVATDERVKELYPHYFESAGNIKSLIDAPIVMANGVMGVICCETSQQIEWGKLEESLAGTFADLIAFLFDSIQQQELEQKLESLAYYDRLTTLPNLNMFYKEAEKRMTYSWNPSVCYIEIDQLNQMIDALGYDSGDVIVKGIADRFIHLLIDGEFLARADQAHFVLFMNHTNIKERIEQIQFLLTTPFKVNDLDVTASFSFGISQLQGSVKELLQTAQIALNRGKMKSSRSSLTYFTEDMKESSRDFFEIEMNLRKGLELNQFTLYYQPQISAVNGQIEGFEALVRWNHPEIGLVPPNVFIPLAESTGFIVPLGEWIIKESIKKLQELHHNGMEEMIISVNISPRQFIHENLPHVIEHTLEQYEVSPDKLCLEITESVAMEENKLVIERLNLFSEKGIQISVDDFGTGFSAFVYLQEYPVNEIKIDREFIRLLTQNKKSEALVKTIIDLAENLDLSVIAEGVETKEQLSILRDLGCQRFQGYLISKPIPSEELNMWMNSFEFSYFKQ